MNEMEPVEENHNLNAPALLDAPVRFQFYPEEDIGKNPLRDNLKSTGPGFRADTKGKHHVHSAGSATHICHCGYGRLRKNLPG